MARPVMRSDALKKRIIDNLNVAVLLFDGDLRLIYINPAGEMLFAISARQAQGLLLHEWLREPTVFSKLLLRSRDSNQALTEREMQLHLPLDRTVTVNCTVIPINEPQLENALLVELQTVDRQLRITREENLLAQHQAARAVVRGLAHEIKNPLGGLRGAAQLLERELSSDTLKEYTGIIIGEADRLQKLVDRMLGPNTLPRKRHVNVHHILEHVRMLVSAEASPHINIIRDYDPSIPEIYADADQIIQATLNIVRNAVQALGEAGHITLRSRTDRQITIGQQYHKLVARIDIVDNGPGIPKDIIEKIFYPMVTGRAGGSGLGLSISQSLINQHGGLIECKSRPGETQFTLLLPLGRPNE